MTPYCRLCNDEGCWLCSGHEKPSPYTTHDRDIALNCYTCYVWNAATGEYDKQHGIIRAPSFLAAVEEVVTSHVAGEFSKFLLMCGSHVREYQCNMTCEQVYS